MKTTTTCCLLQFAFLFRLSFGNTNVGVLKGELTVCSHPVDSGSCNGTEQLRYYFSTKNLKCTEFPYSGCGGNPNNFETIEECKRKCQKSCKFLEGGNANVQKATTIAYSSTLYVRFRSFVPVGDVALVKNIIAAQSQLKCFYGNKTYAVREPIPETTKDSPCSMGCFCGGFRAGAPPKITCASVDCPPYPDEDGCVPIHKEEDPCCSDFYCPSTTTSGSEPPYKCTYKGETFVEGQTIYPDNYPCISCTCSKNFKGVLTTEGGICKEVNCGIQIHHQNNLVKGCLPKFYNLSTSGLQSCCPIEWNCNASP